MRWLFCRLKAELEDAKYKAMKELEEAKREAEARLMIQRSDYEKQLQQLGQTLVCIHSTILRNYM